MSTSPPLRTYLPGAKEWSLAATATSTTSRLSVPSSASKMSDDIPRMFAVHAGRTAAPLLFPLKCQHNGTNICNVSIFKLLPPTLSRTRPYRRSPNRHKPPGRFIVRDKATRTAPNSSTDGQGNKTLSNLDAVQPDYEWQQGYVLAGSIKLNAVQMYLEPIAGPSAISAAR